MRRNVGFCVWLLALLVASFLGACGRQGRLSHPRQGTGSMPSSPQLAQSLPIETATIQQIEESLGRMQAPAGVDAEVFSSLKEKLLSRLAQAGKVRFASKAPTGSLNKVNDLVAIPQEDRSVSFTWSYRNVGDYNQDGLADIADIVPIAEHLFESASPESAWIDGDGNGTIDDLDLILLAENFFNQVFGYLLQGEAPEGSWATIKEVLLNSATKDENGRLVFSATATAEELEGYGRVRVVPMDSELGTGEESNLANARFPIARLRATPQYGDVPLTVSLDASESVDPDGGEIVSYEWDFDGDGVVDETTDAPLAEHTYPSTGVFRASVSVMDDEGWKGFATTEVGVGASEWAQVWLAPEFGWGRSVAVDRYGAVYTVGEIHPNMGLQLILAKYLPDGTRGWAKVLVTPSLSDGSAIEVDPNNDIWLCGYVNPDPGETPYSAYIAKLTRGGQVIWHKLWAGIAPGVETYAMDVAIDSQGNGYVSGGTRSLSDQQQLFVLKCNTNGDVLWSTALDTRYTESYFFKGLEIDPAENPVLAMSVDTESASPITIFTLDSESGEIISQKRITSSDGRGGDAIHAFAVSPEGNIYLAGRIAFIGPPFVLALTADFQLDWATTILGTRGLDDPNAIGVTSSGEVYYGGGPMPDSGNHPGFLMRLVPTPDGNIDISRWEFFDEGYHCSVIDLAIGADGKIYLTGTAPDASHPFAEAEFVLGPASFTIAEVPPVPYYLIEGVESVPDYFFVEAVEEAPGQTEKNILVAKFDPNKPH